jgi:MFS family permease
VMGLVGAIPALATMTSEIVPAAVRGAAFSLTAVLGALMGAFSPPLLGFVADQFPILVDGKSVGNLQLAFRVVTPLVLLGGVVLLQGRRWVAKDLANVASA